MYRLLASLLIVAAVSACAPEAKEPDPDAIQAWRDFARGLEEAGVEVLSTYPQFTELDNAEGLRYLAQQVSAATQWRLLREPNQIALLRVGATTIDKWGLDGSDAKYQGATVNGANSYRLYGTLGSARLFALQIAQVDGEFTAFGALTGDQLGADAEGNFEVMISATKPDGWQGQWLEMPATTDYLFLREYFSDWANEKPGSYYLEQIDAPPAVEPLTLAGSAAMLEDIVAEFANRAPQWQGRVEQTQRFMTNKVHVQQADGQGLAANHYGGSWFSIEPHEALIIEMDAPQARLWSVQLGNAWWESLDYINHTSSFNDMQAVPGSDGKYRFVLSLQDPGVVNWLDPVGHTNGAMMFRFQQSEVVGKPDMKKVAFSDLSRILPGDEPRADAALRAQQYAERRRHAAVRWSP